MLSLRTSLARPRAGAARPVVLVIAGTRPEAIKLAPIVWTLRNEPTVHAIVANSGQHSVAVASTLAEFGLQCDLTLPQLPAFTGLADAGEHLACEVGALLARLRPRLTIVQGDTLTAYIGAKVAHATGHLVAHVEAGLRTDDVRDPFPEEWFRREIARFADLHFTPCRSATANLRAEGIPPAAIHEVGNPGIDSLAWMLRELGRDAPSAPERRRDCVLVTLHRRENYDANAEIVCDALIELADARPDLHFVFPVHPNPRVALPVRKRLHAQEAIALVEPMSYRAFIALATRAALIISDSGGIQEEAPHLGTPLLVPRRNTERPEGLATGFVRLIDVARGAVAPAALAMLGEHPREAVPIDRDAPFGAGDAAQQVVATIATTLQECAYA